MEKGYLEECLAKGMSLEAIGEQVGRHPSTVSYWLKKHKLAACGAEKFTGRGAVDRVELEELAGRGAALVEMAKAFDRNVSTIRYWLKRYEIERPRLRRRQSCEDGDRFATFDCRRHGRTEFVLEGRGYYRCKRCRSEAVARRRRTIKRQLVEEAGGACVLCGYARWVGALQFHHVVAAEKQFHLAQGGYSRSIARSRAEMEKCILLCANCHSEVEGGFATLPVDSIRSMVHRAGESNA